MKKNQLIKLLNLLPDPEELAGLMPRMHKKLMLKALLGDEQERIAHVTLMAILMGTVHKLMNEMPDWEDYLDVSDYRNGEFNEDDIPESCGDPECESCQQMEAAIKTAKESGAQIKVVKLSKEQAIEMGLDVTKEHDSVVKFIGGPDKDTSVH